MKLPLFLIVLLLLGYIGRGQTINKGRTEQAEFYQEIPYTQVNGKIFIPVEINGHMHKFLLDTGAPFTISNEIAAELGITADKQVNTVDAYGNTAETKTAAVKSVKLGDINFINIPAFIGTNVLYQCMGVDGNIGSNLLRNTVISFNSLKKVITITNDATKLNFRVKNGVPLDLKKDKGGSPFFLLDVGNHVSGDFFIDTGSSDFLSLSNTYLDFFKTRNVCSIIATGYGSNSVGQNGAEKDNVKNRVVFSAVKIGLSVFKNVKTETVFNKTGSGDNSIGTKLLDHGILTLDYLHRTLYFDAFDAETDLAEKSWPLSPGFENGKFVIGVVWSQLKDIVKPGVQITAVDGVSFEQIDLCTLLNQKPILQGKDHALLTIKAEDGKYTQLNIAKQ